MHHMSVSGIDGLVQDCSNSSALAMELLQSWTKWDGSLPITGAAEEQE